MAATPTATNAQTAAAPAHQSTINVAAARWLGGLLALIAAGVFFLLGRRGDVNAREGGVLAPPAPANAAASPPDLEAALAPRKPVDISAEDRVVLLKQAYAARGKRVRDIKQG